MALTLSTDPKIDTFVAGNKRFVIGTVTFDSSYPTGGEALTPDEIGLKRIDILIPQSTPSENRNVEWDDANSKILLFDNAATTVAQVANASDQSAVTVQFLAIGV